MSVFNEGDLVEATKGETILRGRLWLDPVTEDLAIPGINDPGYLDELAGRLGFTIRLIERAPKPLPTEPGTVIAIGEWWFVCLRPYETTNLSAWELLPMPTKLLTERIERLGIKAQCVYSADWVQAEVEQEGNFTIISKPVTS